MKNYPYILAFIYVVFFILLGIHPVDRKVWIIEVIPVVFIFLLLFFTFNKFRFSNLSYTLMAIGLFWHTIGAHYTFSNVPFDCIGDMFGFERNNYDRIGHFFVGFYAYPMAEFYLEDIMPQKLYQ